MTSSSFLIDIHTHVPADNASGTFVKKYLVEDSNTQLVMTREISKGLHPWEISSSIDENKLKFLEIEKKLKADGYLAVGETGFDRYFRKDLDLKIQEEVFFWHYELAVELDLPLIVHIVHAHDQFLKVLKKIKNPKVSFLIHDFRGGSEEIKKYLKYENLNFSFGKSLFSTDGKSLERFLLLPLDRVHLETDGDPNVQILDVYQKAKVKTNNDLKMLVSCMEVNAYHLFGDNFHQ